jgi:hypothetical protein
MDLFLESNTSLLLRTVFNGTLVDTRWNSGLNMDADATYVFEINYLAGGNVTLYVDGQLKGTSTSTIPVGGFSVVPSAAYFGNNSIGTRAYDGTISSFVALTPTENTTAPYYKFGSKSAKLVNSGTKPDEYTIAIDPNSTATHTLSAYVYDSTSGNVGGTVSSSIAKLVFNNSVVTPASYTDMGGGWWRLTYSSSTTDASLLYGVQALAGKTIYVDGVQLEAKAYATTYADGSLGTGYSWSGTANESSGRRLGGYQEARVEYPITNFSSNSGTWSMWVKPITYNWESIDNLAQDWNYEYVFMGTGWGRANIGVKKTDLTNQFCAKKWVNSGASEVCSTNNITGKQWVHVAFSFDENAGKLYLNGELANSVINNFSTENFNNSNYPINLGSDFQGVSPSNAVVGDVRIFNVPLIPAEVSDLYYSGLTTHSSGTESDDRYNATGTYTSPTIDLSANGAWGVTPITFSDVLNGGSIAYYTRTSPDNTNWGSWQSVVSSQIASDPRRYLQWKAEMTSNAEQSESPVVTGMVVNFSEDTTAPENPTATALGYSTAATPSADLTSGNWYNFATPKFTWEEATDDPDAGQSESGIDGYHMLLTTNNTATPSASTGDSCYTFAEEGAREFVVGTDPSGCSLSDNTYYLRLESKDNSGNLADPVTVFTYKYDKTNPNPPRSVSSTTAGYTANNSFEFFWPTATDNGPAGVRGYDYKTGSTDPADPFSEWQFTSGTNAANVTAYQEGENYFFVRTVDNSGNVSAETSNLGISPFYFNSTAPTAPQNVVISPETSESVPADENIFTVTWDKPASFSGELAKYHYCVNCTPSATTMTETTASETVARTLKNLGLATQQGKNTFYMVAEDNNVDSITGHGNRNFEAYAAVDFWASTIAPSAPQNLTISDASDRDNDVWRLTLAWEAPSSGGTPAEYQIYRSEDNDTYSDIGTTTVRAFTDDGLTEGTTYYYKVRAVDDAGSESVFSNVVSDAPEGKYTTPPSAGGAPSVVVGSTTAKISWVTSRNAYGSVEYGKTDGYGSSAAETEATTSHEVKISGLAPGQTYHFRTLSLDEGDVVGYERTDAFSSDYSFTTLNTPEITNVEVTDIELDSVVITWETASLATSVVEYGETTEYGKSLSVSTNPDAATHTAQLTNLNHSTMYHFRVRGTTVDEADIFSQDNTFETQTFPKVTALLMQTDQSASGTSVVLAWSTNVPTTGTVEYQPVRIDVPELKAQSSEIITATQSANLSENLIVRTEDGEGVDMAKLQVMDQTQLANVPIIPAESSKQEYSGLMQIKHVMRVKELEDGALYVFTVRGRDKNGNEAISDPIRYVTGADTRAPKIQNVVIETPITGVGLEAKAGIIVSWETDEPASSQVKWGQGTGSEYANSTELDINQTLQHMMVIRDLEPTSSYHIQIESADTNGNLAQSPDTVVVTPAAQEAAFDIILRNLEDVFGFLRL